MKPRPATEPRPAAGTTTGAAAPKSAVPDNAAADAAPARQRRGLWSRLSIWRASSRTVLVSLLAGMLLVVGVTGGSMLFFSNMVVQRQIARLPPELREQFRDHGDPGSTAGGGSAGTSAPTSSSVQSGPGQSGVSQSGISQSRPNQSGTPLACVFPCVSPSPGVSNGLSGGPSTGSAASLPPPLIGPVMPTDQIRHGGYNPVNRARNFLRDVSESLRAASLVSAIFGLLLAAILARRIARPISAVSEAAVRVAAGDLGARAPLLAGDRETTDLALNFNVMAQELQALEQERRDTVASIAHELRTPLTVMQARLDAIEDGIYPLDQEQVLQLSAQTQLLTRLVADLRTLSLAEAGRLTIQPTQVRPLSLARSVAQDIQAARAGSGVRVEVTGQETSLRADPDRLRQVLVNLIENAFKHAQTRILLTVQPSSGPSEAVQPHTEQAASLQTGSASTPRNEPQAGLWVHVDDDGPGIPEGDRERVFENFVRLETSRSRDSGGTGLGLAVVRALMLAHGGEVQLGVSPLGGTRATLRFPPATQVSSD
ncbi:sensor histidine kinase [Deinococcus altitudinis]|uniref:sensor histidine kinase n=1 Tax=Deinococcus altitudinis TaxID=468914 RepID=UPI003891965D